MHRTILMRRRFLIYIRISILFLGATYLLVRHDKLPNPTSWGIPHHSVDLWPVDPPPGTPTSTGYEAGDLPSSFPSSPAGSTYEAGRPKESSSHDDDGEEKSNKVEEEEEPQATGEPMAGGKGEGEEGPSSATASKTETIKPPHPSDEAKPSATPTPKPSKEELAAKARTFLPSILDPNDTSVDRMFCPPVNAARYAHLKASKWDRKPKYFFALNLRKCVDLLPRLVGSLLEAIDFLGPERCAVSVVEGNSGDGTLEVLELLTKEFRRMGVDYHLRTTPLDPSSGKRIQRLAMLRQMALSPVTGLDVPDTDDNYTAGGVPPAPPKLELADDATVLFSNDVAACAEDFLELLHQRDVQEADMSCAMDWTHPGPDALFYDVWVARALNGDLFFDIPNVTASWDNATSLFWNEPVARQRLGATRPFQVFACWNGAVAFAAKPVVRNEVSFRSAGEGECFQGEPQLFCKDMWFRGYRKIMVVPSVNLEYTDALGRRVKKEKGYVSELVGSEEEGWAAGRNATAVLLMVPWTLEPPEKVKCMPNFDRQSWLPWNESLPLNERLPLV